VTTTVLVIGGTGELGVPVARRLRSDGYQVRLLVRDSDRLSTADPDFDYSQGDIGDSTSLESALAGCHAVHISVRGGPTAEEYDRVEHRGTARVTQLAALEGVQRLSYVSHGLAAPDAAAPDLRAKFQAGWRLRPAACPIRSSDPRTSWRRCPGRSVAVALSSLAGSPTHSTCWRLPTSRVWSRDP
jgi:uncharacterized protein YbjT (DUF2867 family)